MVFVMYHSVDFLHYFFTIWAGGGLQANPFFGKFFFCRSYEHDCMDESSRYVQNVDEGRVNSIQKHHKTLIRLLRNNFLLKIGLMVGLVACIAKVNMIFL